MEWADALHTYTLLTIGDGIVTQIPALIISTGTGLIVTRAASDEFLSREVSRQITAYPKTLMLIAMGLMVVLFLPGIPVMPVMIMLLLVSTVAFYAFKAKKNQDVPQSKEESSADGDDLYDMLAVEPIEITVGQTLIPLVGGDTSVFMDRIITFRKQYAMESGLVIPRVRVKDNKKLPPNSYIINIYGAKVAEGELLIDSVLAINPGNAKEKLQGLETSDPTYGLPAVWIAREQREVARGAGYTLVEPITVLMTHLSEIFRRQAANLLNRSETERLIEKVKSRDPGLVEELIPGVLTLTDVQKVLQNLLREKVSIRNLEQIMEVLVDAGKQNKNPDYLTELVRQKLAPVIVQNLANDDGELYVLTLDPSIEQSIHSSIQNTGEQGSLLLEPKMTEQVLSRLASQVEKMMKANLMPVLLCAPELRRHIHRLTERVMPHLAVLSMSEVPHIVRLKSFGMVSL